MKESKTGTERVFKIRGGVGVEMLRYLLEMIATEKGRKEDYEKKVIYASLTKSPPNQ